MSSAKPLAIAATAFGEGAGWRKGQDLIDALPYVDALTPEEKQAVDKLIEEEVGTFSKPPDQHPVLMMGILTGRTRSCR